MMPNPLKSLVPGTRIELVQRQAPRDFKSLASTNSATQARCSILIFQVKGCQGVIIAEDMSTSNKWDLKKSRVAGQKRGDGGKLPRGKRLSPPLHRRRLCLSTF